LNPPVTQIIIASHLLFLFVRAKKIAANQRPGFLQKKNPLTRAEKKIHSPDRIENTPIVKAARVFWFGRILDGPAVI
jgi:hypothetical protein